MSNATHPDFSRTLTAKQLAWCEANGIQATAQATTQTVWDRRGHSTLQTIPVGWGFYFSKGRNGLYIEPIAATHTGSITVWMPGPPENDGEPYNRGQFNTLRDALRFLATTAS